MTTHETTTACKDHFYRVATFFACADLARSGYRSSEDK